MDDDSEDKRTSIQRFTEAVVTALGFGFMIFAVREWSPNLGFGAWVMSFFS